MKKRVIRSSLLAGVMSLLFSFSALQTGNITDVTKPYVGEYECKSAIYGKKDITDGFTYIILDLRPDETFVLRYRTEKGKTGEETGTYRYDDEKKTVRFSLENKGEFQREFPLENGELSVTVKLGMRTLSIVFEQK